MSVANPAHKKLQGEHSPHFQTVPVARCYAILLTTLEVGHKQNRNQLETETTDSG